MTSITYTCLLTLIATNKWGTISKICNACSDREYESILDTAFKSNNTYLLYIVLNSIPKRNEKDHDKMNTLMVAAMNRYLSEGNFEDDNSYRVFRLFLMHVDSEDIHNLDVRPEQSWYKVFVHSALTLDEDGALYLMHFWKDKISVANAELILDICQLGTNTVEAIRLLEYFPEGFHKTLSPERKEIYDELCDCNHVDNLWY